MNISTLTIKNIFDTLPVGYYLGRRIDVALNDGDSAYFDPANDKIYVGAKIIQKAMTDIPDDSEFNLEEIIRGLLYHEISHVILTPAKLKLIEAEYAEIINIFEDERIETLLRKYYMSVNFKKNVILLNKYYKGMSPKNAKQPRPAPPGGHGRRHGDKKAPGRPRRDHPGAI